MDVMNHFADHKKECKENSNYAREILKQHMQILDNDIEKIANLYKYVKIELEALLEEKENG